MIWEEARLAMGGVKDAAAESGEDDDEDFRRVIVQSTSPVVLATAMYSGGQQSVES